MPPEEPVPTPAPTPPAPAAPVVVAPAPAPSPAVTFETQEAFNQRMERAQRKQLKDLFGTDDPAEIEKFKQARLELDKQARDRLTKEQQLETDLKAERAKATAAEADRDRVVFESTVSRACAELGVTNIDYVQFVIQQARAKQPEGEVLDVKKLIAERMADPSTKAAFGMATPPTVVPAPVTTTNNGQPPTPPAPGGGDPNNGTKSAFDLDRQAWADRKAAIGIQ